MKSIKEKAEETYPKTTAVSDLCNEKFIDGANYVLEEIENLVKTTIGEGETYHYNLYMGLQKLVKELKGE